MSAPQFNPPGSAPEVTMQDYRNTASHLQCEPAAVRAVSNVESGGRSGFLASGKLVMLFEGHVFHKYTEGQYDGSHPTISYPTWTKQFYLGGEKEWDRFIEAYTLDPHAALLSASYGKFQVMGYNFEVCKEPTVEDFYTKLNEGEANQIELFALFVKGNPKMLNAIRAKDWPSFARAYNGPQYAANQYDTKLIAAYAKAVADGY